LRAGLGRGNSPVWIFGSDRYSVGGFSGVEHKLFDIYGVNVEFTQSAGTTMIRALDSGSLQVAIVGGGQA
jgi:hypothetical protein